MSADRVLLQTNDDLLLTFDGDWLRFVHPSSGIELNGLVTRRDLEALYANLGQLLAEEADR